MSTPVRGLFDGPAPRILAAPPSAPFLDLLANAMADALYRDDDPFALSDALVLLPNRRAARGLMDAFARRLGGAALLPAIRPLGDPHADDDAEVWGAEPLAFDAPPAIDKTRRRLELAALIRRRDAASGGVDDPARALALADELAKLLDSAATVDEVRWDLLPRLADEVDLAAHWALSAAFLDIVAAYWPQRLAADDLADPAARGALVRRELARRWQADPPERPIVIAGSTGSIATTRALMRVVARLPRGAVLLPGLDVDLDDESWALVEDQHPQFALRETLAALELDRRDAPELCEEAPKQRARRLLMREALAPAPKTADWLARLETAGGARFVAEGADGVRLIEAATEDEEAAAIALMLREIYETPAQSAALVTPDSGLARRVAAKLARWNIAPAMSHGAPLKQCEAGVLLALLCELARDPGEPVALAALLKHPRVRLAEDASALAALEHNGLRGPRRYDSLGELAALKLLEKWEGARAIVAQVEKALAPLAVLAARETITLAEFADAMAEAAESACGAGVWEGADGAKAAELLRDARDHGGELGLLKPYAAPRVLMKLMDEAAVPPPAGGDARIAIWGVLEARLQQRELMILGGLNEGVWPAPAPEDPFMSRAMRAKLGLPSHDQRIGLAAHDFFQLANAPNVVLTRALRREGAPTLASRWLWRLKTLAQGAEAELAGADDYLAWARGLDRPAQSIDVKPPRPCPPAGARISHISVTQVETLIRDPYAIYARRILGLEALKPIGAPAGPAERGIAVHAAIERFEDGEDHARLLDLLDDELRHAGVPPERRAAERARLAISASALIEWFKARAALKAQVFREDRGVLVLPGDVKLTCYADRIEIAPGHAAILDFKTGAPATAKQVESGLAPQLPLEAAILARGGFEHAPAAEATELIYWRLGNAEPTPKPVELEEGAHQAGEKALHALEGLLARYAEPGQPFLSKPRVQFIKPYADYDHLARRKEWADAEGEE